MKALLISFALAACTSAVPAQYEPDAGARVTDALVAPDNAITDAGPNAPKDGCNMGNLPTSRTITLTPSDPVPSALLNELQDQIIGDTKAQWDQPFRPTPSFVTSGTITTVVDPGGLVHQFVMQLASGSNADFDIPFTVGSRIIGLRIEGYGDGAVDWGFSVSYSGSPTDPLHNLAAATSSTNSPASWNSYPSSAFTPRIATASDRLNFSIATSGGVLCIRNVIATFDRL